MFKQLSNPIMICGDNPALHSGLARSLRDIATLCCTLPQFRVAVLGNGIGQRRRLPFITYDYPESVDFGMSYVEQAWNDFAGEEHGIIFTTDDLSRRHWFSNPNICAETGPKQFLGSGRSYAKWAYVPLDSTGPTGRSLSIAATDCALGFDRVLASSEWGCNILKQSSRLDADWLPHGIHPEHFHIYSDAKSLLGWDKSDTHVGCVMTNQARKDWPVAFQCIADLKSHYGNRFRAWIHTDVMIRWWNIYALAADYGVGDCIEVTQGCTDDELALRYSACDCTILPSAGEGFGFPIAESLACGTAAIVTGYAAGQELVPPQCRVVPYGYRIDTQHNVMRAVLTGRAFAEAAVGQIDSKRQDWEYRSGELAESVNHLLWPNLKHLWSRWLLEGLK